MPESVSTVRSVKPDQTWPHLTKNPRSRFQKITPHTMVSGTGINTYRLNDQLIQNKNPRMPNTIRPLMTI